jgi:hypothetical protein
MAASASAGETIGRTTIRGSAIARGAGSGRGRGIGGRAGDMCDDRRCRIIKPDESLNGERSFELLHLLSSKKRRVLAT